MNNVEISGRLVRDPELRKAGNATVCNFSLAVSMGKGDQKKTHFFDMKTWNDNAHRLAENFRKGEVIECQGFATQEAWEKDGVKRSKVVFVVTDHRAPEFDNQRAAAPASTAPAPARQPAPQALPSADDLIVPF